MKMKKYVFRAKSIETGEWAYGSLVQRTRFPENYGDNTFILYDDSPDIEAFSSVAVDPETVEPVFFDPISTVGQKQVLDILHENIEETT